MAQVPTKVSAGTSEPDLILMPETDRPASRLSRASAAKPSDGWLLSHHVQNAPYLRHQLPPLLLQGLHQPVLVPLALHVQLQHHLRHNLPDPPAASSACRPKVLHVGVHHQLLGFIPEHQAQDVGAGGGQQDALQALQPPRLHHLVLRLLRQPPHKVRQRVGDGVLPHQAQVAAGHDDAPLLDPLGRHGRHALREWREELVRQDVQPHDVLPRAWRRRQLAGAPRRGGGGLDPGLDEEEDVVNGIIPGVEEGDLARVSVDQPLHCGGGALGKGVVEVLLNVRGALVPEGGGGRHHLWQGGLQLVYEAGGLLGVTCGQGVDSVGDGARQPQELVKEPHGHLQEVAQHQHGVGLHLAPLTPSAWPRPPGGGGLGVPADGRVRLVPVVGHPGWAGIGGGGAGAGVRHEVDGPSAQHDQGHHLPGGVCVRDHSGPQHVTQLLQWGSDSGGRGGRGVCAPLSGGGTGGGRARNLAVEEGRHLTAAHQSDGPHPGGHGVQQLVRSHGLVQLLLEWRGRHLLHLPAWLDVHQVVLAGHCRLHAHLHLAPLDARTLALQADPVAGGVGGVEGCAIEVVALPVKAGRQGGTRVPDGHFRTRGSDTLLGTDVTGLLGGGAPALARLEAVVGQVLALVAALRRFTDGRRHAVGVLRPQVGQAVQESVPWAAGAEEEHQLPLDAGWLDLHGQGGRGEVHSGLARGTLGTRATGVQGQVDDVVHDGELLQHLQVDGALVGRLESGRGPVDAGRVQAVDGVLWQHQQAGPDLPALLDFDQLRKGQPVRRQTQALLPTTHLRQEIRPVRKVEDIQRVGDVQLHAAVLQHVREMRQHRCLHGEECEQATLAHKRLLQAEVGVAGADNNVLNTAQGKDNAGAKLWDTRKAAVLCQTRQSLHDDFGGGEHCAAREDGSQRGVLLSVAPHHIHHLIAGGRNASPQVIQRGGRRVLGAAVLTQQAVFQPGHKVQGGHGGQVYCAVFLPGTEYSTTCFRHAVIFSWNGCTEMWGNKQVYPPSNSAEE